MAIEGEGKHLMSLALGPSWHTNFEAFVKPSCFSNTRRCLLSSSTYADSSDICLAISLISFKYSLGP